MHTHPINGDSRYNKKPDCSYIRIIGVGGGGGNMATTFYENIEKATNIEPHQVYLANTDRQALTYSPIPQKIQLGKDGRGAGANPQKGKAAAEESIQQIDKVLQGAEMVFLFCGMGGGTGGGATPIIAKRAKEMGILTLCMPTIPFSFEGAQKQEKARKSIQEIKKHCDTVITIPNDRIKEIYGNLSVKEAFKHVDEVVSNITRSITNVMGVCGYINLDFEDLKTVLQGAGSAVVGSAIGQGEGRGIKTIESALHSPMLGDKSIENAKKIFLFVLTGTNPNKRDEEGLKMSELTEITEYAQARYGGEKTEMIFGTGYDETLKPEEIQITIIVTDFQEEKEKELPANYKNNNRATYIPHTGHNYTNKTLKYSSEYNTHYATNTYKTQHPQSHAHNELNLNKKQLTFYQAAQRFIQAFEDGETQELSEETFKRKQEVPAYIRKNISLNYPMQANAATEIIPLHSEIEKEEKKEIEK